MRFSDITDIPGYTGKNYINLNRKEVPYAKKFAETFGFLADYVIDAIHYTRMIGFLSRPYKDGSLGYSPMPGKLVRGQVPTGDQQEWIIRIRRDLFSRTFVLNRDGADRVGGNVGDSISMAQALKSLGVWVENPGASTSKTRYYGSPYDGSQRPTHSDYDAASDTGSDSGSGSGSGDGGNSGSAGTGTSTVSISPATHSRVMATGTTPTATTTATC